MMNKKYIDSEAFRKQLVDRQITTQFFNPRERQEIGCIIEMLDNAPTADVVEVNHGEWIDTINIKPDLLYPGWQCSECGYIILGTRTNYCAMCGSHMDIERKETDNE